MNKRVIIGLSVIAAVAAIAIGGTIAYYSDVETSADNTLVAGTLDLKVDSKCTYNGVQQASCTWLESKDLDQGDMFFNFPDVKPGDSGEDTISLHVDTNDAYVCAGISNVNTTERGCNEAEAEVDSSCGTTDLVQGELQNYLKFTIWKDNGAGDHKCNNILDADETPLVTNQPATNGYWPIADSTTGGYLAGNTTICIGVSWRVPSETGNIIQGDGLSADISFDAFQSRHVPQFICTPQGGCAPQTEMCNGLDDDCDGAADEGWTLGGTCSVGLGACYAQGTYVCDPASPSAPEICSAVAGQPVTESCAGGIDDDCDGTIDCGDPDCANDQACQINNTIRLENKDVQVGGWPILNNDGIYGDLTYDLSGPTFNYSFVAHGLTPGSYSLIYYADPWPGCGTGCSTGKLIGSGSADGSGNLVLSGSPDLNTDLPNPNDENYPGNVGPEIGAKIWLVPTGNYNSTSHKIEPWNPNNYNWLFDTSFIFYDDTDVLGSKIISLTDLGVLSQHGYYHNYAGANVAFAYTTPGTGKISGTIAGTGLKPYATYQLKFDGKPACIYGAAGDDVGNEVIGYMGRWWDNTTNSNVDDTYYLNNSTYHSGTHCITGYLVWGYVTANSSGKFAKPVTTDSSYHVLFCSGGTCGQSNNSQLAFLDPAHQALNLCSAGNVNGEIQRGTCGGLTFAAGNYKLGMVLTEESFHMGPGTWTTVMGGNLEFKIN